jgi:hypothetical protein
MRLDDDKVRLYGRHEDGGFEVLIGTRLSMFGELPAVGDILTDSSTDSPYGRFRVVARYFIDFSFDDRGWAIMVEPIEASEDLTELRRQWAQDTKDLDGPDRD